MSFVTLEKKPKIPRQSSTAAAIRAGKASRALPTVNLLPPSMLERMAVARLRQRFVAGGLAMSVLVGGAWLMQTQRLNSAENRLAAEHAMTPALQAQVDALAPVAAYYAAVDARKRTASQAMAAEVLFSKALVDLKSRTPDGMEIQNMAVTLTPSIVTGVAPPKSPLAIAGIDANGKDTTKTSGAGAAGTGTAATGTSGQGSAAGAAGSGDQSGTAADGAAAAGSSGTTKTPKAAAPPEVACARPDPFNLSPIIGCVTLSGTADSRAVVGEFINALKASNLYADPFVTTTSVTGEDGSETVQYSGSVGLTGAAVSGRYADLSWLSDPKVLAKAERMIRAGETASARLAVQAKRDAAIKKAAEEAAAKAKEAEEAAKQAAAEAAAAAQIKSAAAQAAAAAAALAEGKKNGGTSQ